jgi:hypothetical protein
VVVDSAAELQASAPELGALMSDAIHALGLNLGAQLGERTSGTLMAQVPLTEARRFEWRAGLGVSLHR